MKNFFRYALTLCAGFSMALLCVNAEAISARISYNAANFSVCGGAPLIESGESYTAANGQKVPSPILYTDEAGGTSHFLSVNRIAELLDSDVRWDGQNNTVDFGTADSPWPDTVNAPFTELVWEPGTEPTEAAETLLSGMRVQSESNPLRQSLSFRTGEDQYVLVQVENRGKGPVSVTVFRERAVGPDLCFPTDTVLPGETLCRVFALSEEANRLTARLRLEVQPLPDAAKLMRGGLVPMDVEVSAFQEAGIGDGLEARSLELPVTDSYRSLSMAVTDQTEETVTVEIRNRGEMAFSGGGADDYALERYRDGV